MRLLSLIALALLALGACAKTGQGIQVESATDPKANLEGYKTYAWAGSVGALNDPEGKHVPVGFDVDAEMRFLIDAELRKRGKSFADENADLLVGYMLIVDLDVQKEEIVKRYGSKADLAQLAEGAVVVGLIDPALDSPVWVGVARGQAQGNTGEAAKARLTAAVKKIFSQYP